MPRPDTSLWGLIARGGDLHARRIHGARHTASLDQLACGSSLDCALHELAGRAVLLATADQFVAALAMVELDGIARRLVLCPPDVAPEHLPRIAEIAGIEAVVLDHGADIPTLPGAVRTVRCRPAIARADPDRTPCCRTEWILLTSGTTGLPKLVVHTLASLTGPIKPNGAAGAAGAVWSTFYDIRRYGGLQIFFRAVLSGGSLVLSSAREPVADFLGRVGAHGITHISGTPSHWRRALMSGATDRMRPRYVRLSGEIADQAILDDLQECFPDAGVGHAFASTEAGVAFEVNDGGAGFPADYIGRSGAEVELRIADNSLLIRSPRTASHYLGPGGELRDPDGFVDTGDMLERRGDRYFFVGRRGGIINVGGTKVHPEEVEAVINRHPAVLMSLVKARRNPFTGAVVVAEIVLRPNGNGGADAGLQSEILAACRDALAPHKVPALVNVVGSLAVGGSGKLARRDA
jgi:acyl-CoA synthetase (AMP-forming)/AMP-acid ligase II